MIFTQGSYIEIRERRCLNLRHHGVECSHCMRHCPERAIVCYNDHIYLNKDKCSGCGSCLSDCPTEVFHSPQWDERSIIRDIAEEGWKVTEFFCGRHTLPYKMDKARERGAVQLPACLSIVSNGGWYEAGLNTEVEIHLDQCKDCPLSETIGRLEYTIGIAAEWLEASGHAPEFSYIHQSPQGKMKRKLLALVTGLKMTSRRDLFVSLIRKGQQMAGLTDRTNDFAEGPDQELRNSCLPDWQRRLGTVFQENEKENKNPAYWPAIKLSERCVNCGMCRHYCPSGALQITVKDGICTHYFTNGLCLDCRICQLFCPRGAISRDREKEEKPFAVKTIYRTTAGNCRRCGGITGDQKEELCYWCREEHKNDDEMKDSLKKIFFSKGLYGRR